MCLGCNRSFCLSHQGKANNHSDFLTMGCTANSDWCTTSKGRAFTMNSYFKNRKLKMPGKTELYKLAVGLKEIKPKSFIFKVTRRNNLLKENYIDMSIVLPTCEHLCMTSSTVADVDVSICTLNMTERATTWTSSGGIHTLESRGRHTYLHSMTCKTHLIIHTSISLLYF